jgi:hypothetical protein
MILGIWNVDCSLDMELLIKNQCHLKVRCENCSAILFIIPTLNINKLLTNAADIEPGLNFFVIESFITQQK